MTVKKNNDASIVSSSDGEQTVEKRNHTFLKTFYIRRFFKNLRMAASKQRTRRAISCVLRGDFRFLGHQLHRLAIAEQDIIPQSIPINVVLDTLAQVKENSILLPNHVDLVVPVYNGYEYLRPLFESIKRHTSSRYRLIVIDDASPDSRIWPLLKELVAVETGALLLRNEHNLGFVKTVNKAAQYAEGDFAILNTDIEVPAYWLERLMMPVVWDRCIASTTPFSNAATICSFPMMNIDNELPAGIDAGRVDSCFLRLKSNLDQVEAPTGIGFCMGINGDIWREIGGFDDELFSRGYGEENDWCQRAISKGFRNIIVQNLFVYHKHGGSFEADVRTALREENYKKLIKRWPMYSSAVDCFIKADPLAPARQMATLLAIGNEGPWPPILIVDHDIGGGANVYRRKLVQERVALKQPVFVLTAPQGFDTGNEQLALDFYFGESRVRFEVKKYKDIIELFRSVRLGEIFYNNVVSYQDPLAIVRTMIALKRKTNARLVFAVHDFYALNPSYTLLNAQGKYSGIYSNEQVWLDINKNPFAYNPRTNSSGEWYAAWGELLDCADEVLCFSENSRQHLVEVYPDSSKRVIVRPHTLPVNFLQKPNLAKDKHLHIAVVGSISRSKGASIVAELSRVLAKEDKQARITVIGILEGAPRRSNLRVTGPYKPDELPFLLERCGANVCLLPSIWPETFSYVAEEIMNLEVPFVCFDIGAPAERVSHYQFGQIATEISAEGALEAVRMLLQRLSAL
ncbi:GT2 family glycosyltransferase/glycosyltransferase involved in cell wall biosynthesis [Paenochrobactrum gallinarii]|uniref:GT2 family glycosyltransferase/glycosyltransferase involved in cell wall biosynthesis n=1 Tax=Paenochrobactrum gallinarii TaxID=643673 RepID=A0A841M135_9HYPH|nr:glycosyltransferase [Paenochrobactrum gallinarii]MBB6262472.1 GT2 family glycosyltransferase/glycosyltransferase involved in cell wall biosynthesis [Paenochrobactrum gallinarii]